mgnify:CR=1 FL=1
MSQIVVFKNVLNHRSPQSTVILRSHPHTINNDLKSQEILFETISALRAVVRQRRRTSRFNACFNLRRGLELLCGLCFRNLISTSSTNHRNTMLPNLGENDWESVIRCSNHHCGVLVSQQIRYGQMPCVLTTPVLREQ